MWLRSAVATVQAPPGGKKAVSVSLKRAFHAGGAGAAFAVADGALAAFCFPLGADAQAPRDRMAPECFTFTLTQGDGSRVQGFCRRFLPPPPPPPRAATPGGGSQAVAQARPRFPAVLVLMTEACWSGLFFRVRMRMRMRMRCACACECACARMSKAAALEQRLASQRRSMGFSALPALR
jgi:hypothetical protein